MEEMGFLNVKSTKRAPKKLARLIRETQLCISGDHLFYQKLPFMDNVEYSVLTATEALTVPPLSVIRVPIKVKSARGKNILAGSYGICSTAHDKLRVWDFVTGCC